MFGSLKDRRRRSKWHIDLALHHALADARQNAPAFQRLLRHVQEHTAILRAQPVGGRCDALPARMFAEALLAISAHQRYWLREVETWQPAGESAARHFASLVQHLFAKAPVPAFMNSVWFEGRSQEAHRHQKWFVHLARVHSIRGMTTPIPLSKTMARYFIQAPHHVSANQSIRWCQVRGLGGNADLADAIAATRLGACFEHEAYWSLVIRFLIDNPYLTANHAGVIIDYLHSHPHVYQSALCSKRAKRRAAEEIIRQVRQWRPEPAARNRPAKRITWKSSGIGEFEYCDDRRLWETTSWRIQELLDDHQLSEEGRTMRHCVGNYALRCARGGTTIWSLTRSDYHHQCRRELTLEVNPKSRKIVQAKGLRNSKPTAEARRVTLLWANARGLDPAVLQ